MKACRTEAKTLNYEVKRFMSPREMIRTLESTSSSADQVKNQIDIVPRLPIYVKVPVRDRTAPLRLEFEFFDSETKRKIEDPDVTVYYSTTTPCPSQQECRMPKTDFREPCLRFHSDLKGKAIPEFHPVQRKDRIAEVFLSLHSLRGCLATISVSFPREKRMRPVLSPLRIKHIKAKQRDNLSKQEEHYQEI